MKNILRNRRPLTNVEAGLITACLGVIFLSVIGYLLFREMTRETPSVPASADQAPVPTVSSKPCSRSVNHVMPPEFQRGISLVLQRMEESKAILARQHASLFRQVEHCLDVQYASSAQQMHGAEGMFLFDSTGEQDHLTIRVDPRYRSTSDLYTALVLSHEIMHATNYALKNIDTNPNTSDGCYEDEAWAFRAQFIFFDALNKGEQSQSFNDSFIARMEGTSNEALSQSQLTTAVLAQPGNDVLEKIRNLVKSMPAYRQQCSR